MTERGHKWWRFKYRSGGKEKLLSLGTYPVINIPERREGRPRAAESYQKVTVTLYDRQILSLDKAVLVIRERSGQAVNRAELIRAVLDAATGSLNPEAKDFDTNIRGLLPNLEWLDR